MRWDPEGEDLHCVLLADIIATVFYSQFEDDSDDAVIMLISLLSSPVLSYEVMKKSCFGW